MNRPPIRFIGKMIFFGLAFCALAILVLLFTQYLWNTLAVAVFGLPALTYLQLIGLMILGRLLTGGFRAGRGGGWRGGPGGWQRSRWMRKKWANMSEAERQEMKMQWREKGCRDWKEAENPEAA